MDDEKAASAMLQTVMEEVKPRRAISEAEASELAGDVPRPGSSYQRYPKEADLPETARNFYETAAKMSGISLSTLVRVVYQTELMMERWQENKRRLEYHEQISDMRYTRDSSVDEMDVDEEGVEEGS